MRIWDVPPGYLSRQSLLGEHRELHGLHSILIHGKRGYSRHPETLRWVGCLSGLARRHSLLAAEMRLRGYRDRTPLVDVTAQPHWPTIFVTVPAMQYALLKAKYQGARIGRISLPRAPQDLWAHHKYSVMARDLATYRSMGRRVARLRRGSDISGLAAELVDVLRTCPPKGRLGNALEHMWGYVSGAATSDERCFALASPAGMLQKTSELAVRTRQPYLMASTALSELAAFLPAA